MYYIGLCDDAPAEQAATQALVAAYEAAHPDRSFAINTYASMADLFEAMQAGRCFDLLLFDIYLPGKTGIEGARELRRKNQTTPIIFLTTSEKHALEAFSVDAVQYLVKPVAQSVFFAAMDKALVSMRQDRRRYIALRVEGELRRIEVRDIVYCEAQGNYQCLHLADGSAVRVRITLTALRTLVDPFPDFMPVGIAYVVNLSHVDSLTAKELVLDSGTRIGVPRGAYGQLKEHYFTFYCGKGGSAR